MKLLYFYMKFLDDQGEAKPFRGLNEIELNLSAQDLFHYDSKNNRLERKRRTTPLPENFWVNEAVKDLDTPGHDPSKITNVNVIAGENGSGKSTVIQVFIDLLDALYGSFTGRDRQPLSRHDPRPHRFLLLMEGETERTKKDEHPLVRYLMDYSPQTAQQNPARLDNSYYKEGIKHLTFSFHDWSALYPDAKSIEWKGKEQAMRARDEIRKLLTKTKVVYMTNTLNQRDFARHTSQKTNQRLRDFFVYDCSLGATVGPDISQFFPYEVYKQVKYVFDRNQRVLRQTMYNLIPELRIPHSLRLLPRFEIFSDSLKEQDSDPEGSETQKVQRTLGNGPLTNILGTLCIAGFAFNLAFYANRRPNRDIKWIVSQIIRSLRFGSNPQKLNRTDFSKQLIEVEEQLRALFANDNHSGLGVSCVIETKGGQLVSGSGDNTLRVWDPATGECLRTLERHSGPVTCVIETKGGQLVSGSYDGTLRVWDPATGECLRTLKGHSAWIRCVIETKGGQLVSGSSDNTLRVWDPATGECLRTIWKNPFWKETHTLEDNCVKYLEFLVEKADTLFSKFHRVDELTFELPIDALEEAQPEQTNHTETANTSSLYEDLVTFIQKYRYTCEPTYTIDFDWGLSSGEENMLRLFSNLYHVFDRDYNNPDYGPYAIYNNEEHRPFRELTEPCDTVLLFMDEADLTLHPEWQRRLIHLLTAFLPRIYPAPKTKELQLLLTTHSPLLLGDIPKENVTYLTSGGQVISSEEKDENSPGESFGQNIHTLLRQSFFLRDGTVGEFAAAKINATAAGLQKIIEEKACSSPEEMETLRRTVALTAPGILRAELERLLREAELALQPEQQFPIEQLLSTVKHLTPHQRAELLEALEREGNQ